MHATAAGSLNRCGGAFVSATGRSISGLRVSCRTQGERVVKLHISCFLHSGQPEYHGGTDIDVPNGTPLRAAQAGVVYEIEDGIPKNTFSTENPNGNFVRINNIDGSQTVIIHMLSVGVSVGDVVLPGDPIGTSNNTGRSFKPHAHVQIWRDKNWKRLGLGKEAGNLYDPEVRYGC